VPRPTSSPTARRVAGIGGLLELLDAGRLARDPHRPDDADLLTHGLRCAAVLETLAPGDLELQVAGLVHDLGTLLEPRCPDRHPAAGAEAVRPLLGRRVADLVAGHEDAVRYLVTVDVSYRSRLGPGAREHLRRLGGLMDPDERSTFLARPDAEALVTLRRADDTARTPAGRVPSLDHWTLALYAVAATARP